MPKNRMTFHDPCDELPPVTIEILEGDVLRFTQIDREGRTNTVSFSDRFDVRRGGFDVTARPIQPLKAEG